MYQTGKTIKQTLDEIHTHQLVLPAIQREFVWGPTQIQNLFDSIMQGYPFNTFLYWQVDPENSDKIKFYDFVRNYHQRDNPHCPPLPSMPNQKLTAVLDGQQRLTALNVGLRGTMAWKLPRLWWNNPEAFPIRKLYLDLLWRPDEDDEMGSAYRFRFLTERQAKGMVNGACWFPVRDILSMNGGPPMVRWLNERLAQEHVDNAYEVLDRLHSVVHKDHMLAYYEEREQDIEKVLQIFIRTNSGGTILSYSDLLLSVAVAQWDDIDAREEIHSLVDELNGIGDGFNFSKDMVLKAGLMLSDIGSVGFKVENFNKSNMEIFEEKWDGIKRALTLTVQLISSFGFNRDSLRAHNAILPIAYYLFKNGYGDEYLTQNAFNRDRENVREWLIRSLLKSGVWGSGLDVTLTALRQTIRANGNGAFPSSHMYDSLARRGRSLVFDDEEIEELVDMQYGHGLTRILLSILFPFIDSRNHFHVDHIFPLARLTRAGLRSAGVPDNKIEDFYRLRNGLPNLQLLQGAVNQGKSAKMPSDWISETYPDLTQRQGYVDSHILIEMSDSITDFEKFYQDRREALKIRIRRLLGRRDN